MNINKNSKQNKQSENKHIKQRKQDENSKQQADYLHGMGHGPTYWK